VVAWVSRWALARLLRRCSGFFCAGKRDASALRLTVGVVDQFDVLDVAGWEIETVKVLPKPSVLLAGDLAPSFFSEELA